MSNECHDDSDAGNEKTCIFCRSGEAHGKGLQKAKHMSRVELSYYAIVSLKPSITESHRDD